MSESLMKIKSKYNLKAIFSIVNYERILKLIKYNKELQENLNINILNYKNRTSYQFFEKNQIRNTFCESHKNLKVKDENCLKLYLSFLLVIILFIYVLIVASIIAAKGTFNKNNTKENIDENYIKIINKINLSLFGFLAYIIVSYIIIFVWVTNNCYRDYGIMKFIKKVILILIAISYLFYDIVIIYKLYLSYRIKRKKTTWFMRCDYVLIIFIFFYLVFLVFIIYLYFLKAGGDVITLKEREIILTKFRDIEINNFGLPLEFKKKNKIDKTKYVLSNKNNYEIKITREQVNILNSINEIRKENNIDELTFFRPLKFKDLIIEQYSAHYSCREENIFKFSNGYYLLKYPFI